jgi:hypothetical protein
MAFQHDLINSIYGQRGSSFIDAGTSKTGDYVAIIMLEDTTFNTLIDATRDGDTVNSSQVFRQGITIFGSFSTIDVATGAVIAYKR